MKKVRRFFTGFRYGQRGFTLIELLVVIGILGIIAAIVIPNFATFFGRGQDEAEEIEFAMVKTATMAYASDNGACPPNIAALDPYFENPGDVQCTYTWAAYPACTVTSSCVP